MTPHEPVTGESSLDHCYLKTSEFTNNPRINQFTTGTITYNDLFEDIDNLRAPQIKVSSSFISLTPGEHGVVVSLYRLSLSYRPKGPGFDSPNRIPSLRH